MLTWYKTHKKQASYSNEIAGLNRYLKEGFDPYDYQFEIKDFLESNGQETAEDKEEYEIFEEWIEKASKEEIASFKHWIENRDPRSRFEGDAPVYEAMSYSNFVKPTWLIHFTNDPSSISQNGFLYGHEDTGGLALTTWKTDRKKTPGYNFAFEIGSRYADYAARSSKYGKHAVVFWGAGVKAYHYGDEEDQVIIWGQSVNKSLIFPVWNEDGEWVFKDIRSDKIMAKGEDVNEIAYWIRDNNRALQNIRENVEKRQREYDTKHEIKRSKPAYSEIPEKLIGVE